MTEIRRAEATDEAALSRVRQRAILGLAVPAISVEEAEAWAAGVAVDRIARAIKEHTVWVAVAEDVIGWVEIDQDWVAALYVVPAAAHQGVGSSLLKLAETAVGQAGYTTVRLHASPNALAFYLRRGYAQVGPQTTDGSWPLTKTLPT